MGFKGDLVGAPCRASVSDTGQLLSPSCLTRAQASPLTALCRDLRRFFHPENFRGVPCGSPNPRLFAQGNQLHVFQSPDQPVIVAHVRCVQRSKPILRRPIFAAACSMPSSLSANSQTGIPQTSVRACAVYRPSTSGRVSSRPCYQQAFTAVNPEEASGCNRMSVERIRRIRSPAGFSSERQQSSGNAFWGLLHEGAFCSPNQSGFRRQGVNTPWFAKPIAAQV